MQELRELVRHLREENENLNVRKNNIYSRYIVRVWKRLERMRKDGFCRMSN